MDLGRRIGIAAVMAFVVAALFVAGVHNYRARRAAVQQAQAKMITLTKDGSDASGSGGGSTEGEGAKLKGHAAPAFTLTDLQGRKVSLADFKGHPVVLNFWATWCGPCKLEMPWFEEFSNKYKDKGLVVLGISQDDLGSTPKEEIAGAVKKLGVDYTILLPDDKVHKLYGGVDYLPETFYVDKNGLVVADTAGAPSKDEMEALINKTIAAGGM